MSRYYMPIPPFFRRFSRLCAVAVLFFVAGCAYKTEIRQGDIALPEKIALLKIGMTRDEVRATLGENRTPAVFNSAHWVYYYRHRSPGFLPEETSGGVLLEFAGDKLSRIQPLAPESE